MFKPAAGFSSRSNPKSRAVQGYLPGQVSLLEKDPRHAQKEEQRRQKNIQEEQKQQILVEEKRKLDMENLKVQLEKKSEVKRHAEDVKHKVSLGVKVAEQALEEKKERLRRVLFEEEDMWTRMAVEKSQREKERKLEEIRQQAERLKAEKEVERKALVEKKRIQQYMERSDSLRPMIFKRNQLEAKETLLYQMKEKKYIEEKQKDLDRMWNNIIQKEIQAKLEREMEDTRRSEEIKRITRESLEEQLKARQEEEEKNKRIKEETLKEFEKIKVDMKKDEEKMLEEEWKKKQKAAKDLQEQILLRQNQLKQKAQEQAKVDQCFALAAEAELRKQMEVKTDTKMSLSREQHMFIESHNELQRRRREEEREIERQLQEDLKNIEDKRAEAYCALQKARQELLTNVLKDRQAQIEYQKVQALEEKHRIAREKEFVELQRQQNLRLKEEHDRMMSEYRKKYAQDLKDQMEYKRQLRQKECDELNRQYMAGKLEEECYTRILRELLGRPLEKVAQHPFLSVIDGSAVPL